MSRFLHVQIWTLSLVVARSASSINCIELSKSSLTCAKFVGNFCVFQELVLFNSRTCCLPEWSTFLTFQASVIFDKDIIAHLSFAFVTFSICVWLKFVRRNPPEFHGDSWNYVICQFHAVGLFLQPCFTHKMSKLWLFRMCEKSGALSLVVLR